MRAPKRFHLRPQKSIQTRNIFVLKNQTPCQKSIHRQAAKNTSRHQNKESRNEGKILFLPACLPCSTLALLASWRFYNFPLVLGNWPAMRGSCRSEERRVGKECRSRWSP